MFDRFIKWWNKTFPKCVKCGSNDTIRQSNYTRGYNNLCQQAYGDWGRYCCNCHHIEWDTPYDEHIKTLPNWCTPYKKS